jgi:hypothetical protein
MKNNRFIDSQDKKEKCVKKEIIKKVFIDLENCIDAVLADCIEKKLCISYIVQARIWAEKIIKDQVKNEIE